MSRIKQQMYKILGPNFGTAAPLWAQVGLHICVIITQNLRRILQADFKNKLYYLWAQIKLNIPHFGVDGAFFQMNH